MSYRPKPTVLKKVHPVLPAIGFALLVIIFVLNNMNSVGVVTLILGAVVIVILFIWHRLECPYCSYGINKPILPSPNFIIRCTNCNCQSQLDIESKQLIPLDDLLLPEPKRNQRPTRPALMTQKTIEIELRESKDLESM